MKVRTFTCTLSNEFTVELPLTAWPFHSYAWYKSMCLPLSVQGKPGTFRPGADPIVPVEAGTMGSVFEKG